MNTPATRAAAKGSASTTSTANSAACVTATNETITMADCVLPGCQQQVSEPGETCPACIAAFGDWLKPSEVLLTAEQIRARDEYVQRAYHAQRGMQ